VIVGADGAACVGGSGALVGANSFVPQLRQKFSPGAAGVPHFGHKVALRVGSLIFRVAFLFLAASNAVGRCFYRETKIKSTKLCQKPERQRGQLTHLARHRSGFGHVAVIVCEV